VAHIEVVPKAKHRFLMGMQHRRTGTDNENGAWVMQNHDSTIFFLQNEVARQNCGINMLSVYAVAQAFGT